MKINRPTTPSSVLHAIASALRDQPPAASGAAWGAERISDPLPLYGVNTAALVDGDRDEIFTFYGWRALVETDGAIRFVDVEFQEEEPRVTRIVAGGAVGAILEAGERAAEQIDSNEAYELRMIEAPAVKTAALWLAGQSGEFICYSEAGVRAFDEAGFIELLRSRAEGVRAAYVRGIHHWKAERSRSPELPERPSDDDSTGGNEP